LLAQSGLQRATLDLQLTTVAASARWLDVISRVAYRARPWLLAVAPLAGWLVARRSLRVWDIVRGSLPLARTLLSLLRR
jgi:hypothetical protein